MGKVGDVAITDEFGKVITPTKENTQLDVQDLLESIQDLASTLKFLGSVRGLINDLRVTPVTAGPTQPVSGTVTVTSTTLTGGQAAHSAAVSGNPLRGAAKVSPTTIATQEATLVASDTADFLATSAGQLITKPFATPEVEYSIPVLPNVTTTTVQNLVAASGTALIRNYITQLNVQTDTLGAAGNMFILDAQGAIGTSVTIATPGVFTSTAHDLKIGDAIIFTAIGTITGISINTIYYVTGTTLAATTFTIALTPGGTAIQITGSTSAFTFYRVLDLVRLPTTALTAPIVRNYPNILRGIANANLLVYFPTSLTSGTVYLTVTGHKTF